MSERQYDIADYPPAHVPGKASDYIEHAEDVLLPGTPVWLWVRESGHVQDSNGNLDRQLAFLRLYTKDIGVPVAGVTRHVGSGYDPHWVGMAGGEARRHNVTILLAESTDRFIRPPEYSKYCQDLQARDVDLVRLRNCTPGLMLATFLHPDAPPTLVRGFQAARGQHMSGRFGGRPPTQAPGYKKQRREELLPRVRELIRDGLSNRKIAAEIGVAVMTVSDWVREYGLRCTDFSE